MCADERFNWMGMSRRTGDMSAAGGVGRTPITAPSLFKTRWEMEGRDLTSLPKRDCVLIAAKWGIAVCVLGGGGGRRGVSSMIFSLYYSV